MWVLVEDASAVVVKERVVVVVVLAGEAAEMEVEVMVVVDWEGLSAFVMVHKGMYPLGRGESMEYLR